MLQEQLRKDIENGVYKPNDPIPSDNELMKKYKLSKSTVTRALTNLVNKGYIFREQGRGSFVCPNIKSSTNLSLWIASEEEIERNCWRELVKDFNQSNTDCKIDLRFITYGPQMAVRDVLYRAFASGMAPDILSIDGPDVPYWAYINAIRPLDDYISHDFKSKFIPTVIRQGTYKGRLYHLGYSESTMCIIYDKEIFANLSIQPPEHIDNAWTWKQFTDVCQVIKEETDLIPLAMNSGKGISTFRGEWCTYSGMVFLWQNNASPFNTSATKTSGYLNSDLSIEAMTWLGKLYHKYKYTHTQTIQNAFPNKAAMSLVVQASLLDLYSHYPSLNLGVIPLPYNRKAASPHGGWGLTITSQSKNPDKAWKFIEYVFTLENQLKFFRATGMPVFKQIYDIYYDINRQINSAGIIFEQLEKTAITRPVTPAYPNFSQVFAQAYIDIANGKDAKKVLDAAALEIDRDIESHGNYSINETKDF